MSKLKLIHSLRENLLWNLPIKLNPFEAEVLQRLDGRPVSEVVLDLRKQADAELEPKMEREQSGASKEDLSDLVNNCLRRFALHALLAPEA
ncbi:MAG: hypothetical protein N2C14_17330 [Planctomycetales bacterium]